MRHRIADKKFNRTSNARKALFTGLLRNLTEHGEIVTTLAKAKAVKRLADRMVSQAKVNTVATRRLLHKRFGKRDVVSTLVERVAPAMADRTSGFVTLTNLGPRRGDNTQMAKLGFVKKSEQKSLKNPLPKNANSAARKTVKTAEKKVAPAKTAAPKTTEKKPAAKKITKKAA